MVLSIGILKQMKEHWLNIDCILNIDKFSDIKEIGWTLEIPNNGKTLEKKNSVQFLH